MVIQNIQIVQDLLRRPDGKSNSGKENVSAENGVSVSRSNISDNKDTTAGTTAVSGGKDLMRVVYPPFFPIGNTQDILAIETVNLNGEEAKSASVVSMEEQKANRQKETNAKMINVQVRMERRDTAPSSDTPIRNNIPQIKHEVNPGDVLDLKV